MNNPLIDAMRKLLDERIVGQPQSAEREQAIDDLGHMIRRLRDAGRKNWVDTKRLQAGDRE